REHDDEGNDQEQDDGASYHEEALARTGRLGGLSACAGRRRRNLRGRAPFAFTCFGFLAFTFAFRRFPLLAFRGFLAFTLAGLGLLPFLFARRRRQSRCCDALALALRSFLLLPLAGFRGLAFAFRGFGFQALALPLF